jgi:molybdopterin/thiamine biosynthesis adenylyltransferase
MTDLNAECIPLVEGRFARFESIAWWDQKRLKNAKILVVGAGALGNEVIKNLALLGVGHLAIVDLDHIELSNLSRSVLFRANDEGKPKAVIAAAAATAICPEVTTTAIVGNLMADVGLGWFRWADAVIGALDNREARLFVNQCCARLGKPWIDGGIEVLNGVVRGYHPPHTACYECGMSEVDWQILSQRRSCSLLARRAIAARGVPTTPTTASIIGAIQVQEVVKVLHGLDNLLGAGFLFEGLGHGSYRMDLPINPHCSWHEPAAEVREMPWCADTTTLKTVRTQAYTDLGGLDAIDLIREIAEALTCPTCNVSTPCWQPLESLTVAVAQCPQCAGERVPLPRHSFPAAFADDQKTLSALGVPNFDIIYARHGDRVIGYELSGDTPPSSDHGSARQ